MNHRCINQTLPGPPGPCSCPPPEPAPQTVWVVQDRMAYEGESLMGIFDTEMAAYAWIGRHTKDFAGRPQLQEVIVQQTPTATLD